MQEFLRLVGCGYTLILILISCIIGIWHNEWQEVEALESDNRQIDDFRKDINNIHIQLIEFSLLGETILEWDDEDLGLRTLPCPAYVNRQYALPFQSNLSGRTY